MSNLIVFDNMSTSPDLLDYYKRMSGKLLVCQFSGFHNHVHRPERFPKLFEALRKSARYFTFLDADERLIWIDQNLRHHAGAEVLAALEKLDDPIVPGIWLDNLAGYEDRFRVIRDKDQRGLPGIRTGKVIVSGSVRHTDLHCHNFQMAQECYGSIRTNFFVLHLKRLSAQQRISANFAKLKAYNAMGSYATIEDLIAADPETIKPGNPRQWVREIQYMAKERSVDSNARLKPGSIQLAADGSIRFSEDWQKDLLAHFVANPNEYRDLIFTKSSQAT